MATVAIMAVPAKPGLKKKVTLSDGSVVELTLRGDEHYAFYTDASGEPCQFKQGKLLKITHEEVNQQWAAQREKRLAFSETTGRRANRRVGEKQGATTGNHRGLVILMQFPDMPFATKDVQNTFQRFFNEEGYHEGGMTGSVRDYFKKQSYDKLTIDFDVAGPFTTQYEMEYYGGHYTDSYGNEQNDKHPALMVAEAVDSAHQAGIDFSKYDWDGDGVVDQVFVIYAGHAEAQGADPSTIWPHEWSLAAERATRYYDNVVINTYGCAAELWGANSEANPDDIDGIGTACHEFSHCLGLPDTYDTQGDNYGMGYWDIMCAGNYNNNSRTPAGYTSYERWFSGWLEPKELSTITRVTDMKPLIEEPEAYVLYNDKNRNEYYLLENRQPISYDKGLYGHGLLVLHVDYDKGIWNSNSVNTVAGHERMTIIAADNEYGSYYQASIAGDPFPGHTGNTALTNYTTPAATLYHANTNGQKLMSKPIDNITENTITHTVSFVACRPELATPEAGEATELPDGNSFTVTWPAVSGAIGYELKLNIMGLATYSCTSDTNSYTFKDMDVTKRYSYRIRALGEDGTHSQWSEENTFEFGTTGIQGISHADENTPVRYYDLQGREVSSTTRGVLIRKQGHNTKKVLH